MVEVVIPRKGHPQGVREEALMFPRGSTVFQFDTQEVISAPDLFSVRDSHVATVRRIE